MKYPTFKNYTLENYLTLLLEASKILPYQYIADYYLLDLDFPIGNTDKLLSDKYKNLRKDIQKHKTFNRKYMESFFDKYDEYGYIYHDPDLKGIKDLVVVKSEQVAKHFLDSHTFIKLHTKDLFENKSVHQNYILVMDYEKNILMDSEAMILVSYNSKDYEATLMDLNHKVLSKEHPVYKSFIDDTDYDVIF